MTRPLLKIAFPVEHVTSSLLALCGDANVGVFLDFFAPGSGKIRKALEDLACVKTPLTIRVFRGDAAAFNEIIACAARIEGLYLPAEEASPERVVLMREAGIRFGLIVESLAGAKLARRLAGGLPPVARGKETGGFNGRLATLVVFQVLQKNLAPGASFLLEGGLDIPGAGAAVTAGASGVVFGAAAWGMLVPSGQGSPANSRTFQQIRAHETLRLADERGYGLRFFARPKPDLAALRRLISGKPISTWLGLLPSGTMLLGQDVGFAHANMDKYSEFGTFFAEARRTIEEAAVSAVPANIQSRPDINESSVRMPLSEVCNNRAGLSEATTSTSSGLHNSVSLHNSFSVLPTSRTSSYKAVVTAFLNSFDGRPALRFPIIQGPMAGISDRPEFLKAVLDAGALPVAAFASLSPDACKAMLEKCDNLGVSPGIGIIGFDVMSELVERQLTVLEGRPRPPLVLVAAPKPALVARLVDRGYRVMA
ncbi:MAG: hypothetical protein HQM09_25025, partial [Candidatus Riflebacteria bacterium]|nr:hypothetical protein [Candidatus Riflebacteria bacterium]